MWPKDSSFQHSLHGKVPATAAGLVNQALKRFLILLWNGYNLFTKWITKFCIENLHTFNKWLGLKDVFLTTFDVSVEYSTILC